MIALALLVTWIALVVLPAVIASRKGRSALGFLLLAIFLTPLVALPVALIISPAPGRVA